MNNLKISNRVDMEHEIRKLREDMTVALRGAKAGETALRKQWFGHKGGIGYSEFEVDGTLVFNDAATVWDDLYLGFEGSKIPGVNTPTWGAFVGNLNAYTFAVNDYLEPDCTELIHRYKEGSDFDYHIHWATNGVDVTDRYVRWEVEYSFSNMDITDGVGDVYPAPTVVSAETMIPANTPNITNMYTAIAGIVGADALMGATFKSRVRRIAATGGAAPSNNPFGLMAGIHIEIDTVGSREIGSK